ncbi:MAG: hypothetical protein RIR00_1372 [Pseudomonadota bacterium]|jgi:diguanylate cyclase (GGDEF)-like protein/PAS domain S-box-containing protein
MIALIWGVVVIVSLVLILGLGKLRQQAENRGREQAQSYARLIKEHAQSIFFRSNQTLDTLLDALPPGFPQKDASSPAQKAQLERYLRQIQERTPGIASISITDAAGIVQVNSRSRSNGQDLSDRNYFKELLEGSGSQPVISEALKGRVSGLWGIQIARRIEDRQGRFAGMIVINQNIEQQFEPFYRGLANIPDTMFSLRDRNHRLLIHHPVIENELGRSVMIRGLTDAIDAGSNEGTLFARSPLDGKERIMAYQHLDQFGLYALTGLPEAAYLGDWRNLRDVVAVGMAGLWIVAALLSLLIRRKQKAEQRIAAFFATSPTAVAVVRLDGRVLHLNQRFQEMFGYTQEDLPDLNAWWNLAYPDPEYRRSRREAWEHMLAQALAGESLLHGEGRVHNRDGSQRWVATACRVDQNELLVVLSDISQRVALEEKLRQMAYFDVLTGALSRHRFLDLAGHEVQRVQRSKQYFSLLMIDLDHFKAVNDKYGHAAGDTVLRVFAERCKSILREVDLFSRFGGEEFVALLPMTNLQGGLLVAERLRREIAGMGIACGERYLSITISIGITEHDPNQGSLQYDLSRADKALYQAKTGGRNRVMVAG